MKKLDFIVEEEDADQRIDLFLSDLLPLSRTQIQNLIKTDKVLVNKQKIKANYKVQSNDQIAVEYVEAQPLNIQSEKMDPGHQ